MVGYELRALSASGWGAGHVPEEGHPGRTPGTRGAGVGDGFPQCCKALVAEGPTVPWVLGRVGSSQSLKTRQSFKAH